MITLVDVGGLGGLGEEWKPHLADVRAVLFEPSPDAAAELRNQTGGAREVIVIEQALGAVHGRQFLNIARSPGCTSLLRPNRNFLEAYSVANAFEVTRTIPVECVRYDALLAAGQVPQPDAIKLDVQGFEYQVLMGFGAALENCLAIKTEAHFYQMYEGQKLLPDLIDLLSGYGFALRKIEPVNHFDGDIVEVDAFFTCSIKRAGTLSEEQSKKLSFIEKVWSLGSRSKLFSPHQFG